MGRWDRASRAAGVTEPVPGVETACLDVDAEIISQPLDPTLGNINDPRAKLEQGVSSRSWRSRGYRDLSGASSGIMENEQSPAKRSAKSPSQSRVESPIQ